MLQIQKKYRYEASKIPPFVGRLAPSVQPNLPTDLLAPRVSLGVSRSTQSVGELLAGASTFCNVLGVHRSWPKDQEAFSSELEIQIR